MLTVSPLPSEALAGYEENPTVKLFDCRVQGAGSLKTIRADVSSRAGRGSMGEQQQQQQLRDAMRTFGVVFFYGPTVHPPHSHCFKRAGIHYTGEERKYYGYSAVTL